LMDLMQFAPDSKESGAFFVQQRKPRDSRVVPKSLSDEKKRLLMC
jgi:hypothetical protein